MNPRYEAYAKANGLTVAQTIDLDNYRWPGGRMCGFILWVSACWSAWEEESGFRRSPEGHGPEQHHKFDVWLTAAVEAGSAPQVDGGAL